MQRLIRNHKGELSHIEYYSVDGTKEIVPAHELPDEIKNELIKMQREEQTLARYERHLNLVSYDDPDFVEPATTYDNKRAVNTHKYFDVALKALPLQQYKLLYAIYYEKISQTEIAKRENVSKSAISHRLGRAHTALRKQLLRYDLFPNTDVNSDLDNVA